MKHGKNVKKNVVGIPKGCSFFPPYFSMKTLFNGLALSILSVRPNFQGCGEKQ